jgi:hypothetical protein
VQGSGYDHDYGPHLTYPHSYPPSFPQAKSNPQWAYCYPEDALRVFRRWDRYVYPKDGLPKYLTGKTAKGEITSSAARAVLTALGTRTTIPEFKVR